MLELQARRSSLAAEADALRARLDTPIPEAAYSLERNPAAYRSMDSSPSGNPATRSTSRWSTLEAPLRAEGDTGSTRSGELGAELRRLGAAEVELRQELAAASEAVSTIEVEAARPRRRSRRGAAAAFEQANADEPAEGDDREELAATVERLERRRETLGQVNPLAQEEYEAEKVRLEELAAQRADLESEPRGDREAPQRADGDGRASLHRDLRRGPRPLRGRHGDRLPRRRRPTAADRDRGRRGRRSITGCRGRAAPRREACTAALAPLRRRKGARRDLVPLRPLPRAAVSVLPPRRGRGCARTNATSVASSSCCGRYSDRAQFVVITHQKRTMEAADVLYGVTMGGDGVSQIVSRRLPREDAEAVARRSMAAGVAPIYVPPAGCSRRAGWFVVNATEPRWNEWGNVRDVYCPIEGKLPILRLGIQPRRRCAPGRRTSRTATTAPGREEIFLVLGGECLLVSPTWAPAAGRDFFHFPPARRTP